MIRMPDKKINIEKLSTMLLWILAISYFYFISVHSALPANSSTKASEGIVEKTYSVVKNVTEAVQGEGKKGISYTKVVLLVRKSAHMLNFYILSFLYCMTALKINSKKLSNVFAVTVICGFFGAVIDEWHQFFVPGRRSQISDVLIDFTGVYGGGITCIIGILVFNVKNTEGISKMKKTKVLLIFLLIIVLLTFGIGVWQWNNIIAVYKTVTTTQEQLEQEINKNKQALEEELNKKYSTIVSDFSAEEEKKLLKGEISVEQAVENLNKRYEKKKNDKTQTVQSNNINAEKIDELIGDKVIELYSLKAYYLGQLGQMEATVKSEYAAMPAEKKNFVGKKELASKHMGVALGLMNQCDAKVSKLVSELESELKKLGGDTAIIKTIKDAYENEKALKKAQYLKLLNE